MSAALRSPAVAALFGLRLRSPPVLPEPASSPVGQHGVALELPSPSKATRTCLRRLRLLLLTGHGLMVACVPLLILANEIVWFGLDGRWNFSIPGHTLDLDWVMADSWRPPPPLGDVPQQVALLFMVRTGLQNLKLWRLWLEPAADFQQEFRVRLYFHLADGATPERLEGLLSLPGNPKIVPTTHTAWCELMRAEVALFRYALEEDNRNTIFVLLSHDSVPIAPFDDAMRKLLKRSAGNNNFESRICFAGVRKLDVPGDCQYAMLPRWQRRDLMKHHQWMVLNRTHASKIADSKYLKAARGLFMDFFSHEPMCSDEVVPILALAMPDGIVQKETSPGLYNFPLYLQTDSLEHFNGALRDELGIDTSCITYAYWPGCVPQNMSEEIWPDDAKLGDGGMPWHWQFWTHHQNLHPSMDISNAGKKILATHLFEQGVLFWRKLGPLGGDETQHMLFLKRMSALRGMWQKKYGNLGSGNELNTPRLLPEASEGLPLMLAQVGWATVFPQRGWFYSSSAFLAYVAIVFCLVLWKASRTRVGLGFSACTLGVGALSVILIDVIRILTDPGLSFT